jgi:hypothetical protein
LSASTASPDGAGIFAKASGLDAPPSPFPAATVVQEPVETPPLLLPLELPPVVEDAPLEEPPRDASGELLALGGAAFPASLVVAEVAGASSPRHAPSAMPSAGTTTEKRRRAFAGRMMGASLAGG